MNSESLGELARGVMTLLEKYDIDEDTFTLSILVSREYYQAIKDSFPDRHPTDMIVGSSEEHCAIGLLYRRLPKDG